MLLLATVFVAMLVAETSGRVVDTIYGQVDGNTVVLDNGFSVDTFYGIPYARPPIGDLRFAYPQSPEPWNGVLPTKELPNACMQDLMGIIWYTHPFWDKYSEDCLTLNIYSPSDTAGGPYPVMVWFHGGAYLGGANFQYPGHFLSKYGVVVVSANYRLGAFGFLATPDKTVKGNAGLFDQAMALRFVRNNIANFGGDPGSVTIFGQSAGAGSSSLHMTSPYSQGLFHKAIMESGTEQNIWSLNYPDQKPETYVYQLAEKTNCTRDTDPEMVACLRTVSATDIRINQDVECTPGFFCQGFAPIVDGPGGFVPSIPKDIKENLGTATVPIISGICKDDGSLYTPVFIPEANDGGFNGTMFEYYLQTRLIDIFAVRMTPEAIENTFEGIHYNYAPYPYHDDLEGNRQAMNRLLTDAAFGYSWDNQLKTNSEFNVDTYAYVEAFLSPNSTSFIPEWMGVPHMGELPYVWGYAHLLNNPDVRDDSGIYYDAVGWTPDDIVYADFQMLLWANFARYSNPTPEPVKAPFSDTMVTWNRFSWEDHLKVLWLDREPIIKEDYLQRDYAFWREYLVYLSGGLVPEKKESVEEEPRTPLRDSSPFYGGLPRDGTRQMIADLLAERGILVEYDEFMDMEDDPEY